MAADTLQDTVRRSMQSVAEAYEAYGRKAARLDLEELGLLAVISPQVDLATFEAALDAAGLMFEPQDGVMMIHRRPMRVVSDKPPSELCLSPSKCRGLPRCPRGGCND